jgi:hypothetical protein
MKFPAFPEIEGYPCTDPDLYWGYACAGHVPLNEFRERCREVHGLPDNGAPLGCKDSWPPFVADRSLPCHAFVSWHGKGGWQFCFPDDQRAKPITYWPADSCSYCEWLMGIIRDVCHGERHNDALVLRAVHAHQLFAYGSYRAATDVPLAAENT